MYDSNSATVTDDATEVSRGFGFIRFSTLEESKAFIERNYPAIFLNSKAATGSDDQAAKVRIAFSRERDDRSRGEKAEGEWVCKIVNYSTLKVHGLSLTYPVHLRQFSRPHKMSQVSDTADR